MREQPPQYYNDRYRSCWCKGWNWVFVGGKVEGKDLKELYLFEYTDEIKGDYRTFLLGDLIENQYFGKNHWCVENGFIKLIPENKYHNIDEAWQI